jgi:hypothetical protein
VSHEGEEHRATPGVMTYGATTAGEVLAERYRLEDHVDTDAAGRQIWRGIDMVLRRPVAVILREPGGEAAEPMLTVAVAMSRLVHPHIVSVYDAIDEGQRAYLVREWVPGIALRDVLRQAPLDAERATLVTHAIAEAVSALHSAGIAHGNVHPGTILIADDGRVVLADAHADGPADPVVDVRAVGAVLYACLTGLWPYAEAGHGTLPDAVRDNAGRLATPRQVRGGIPRHLDEIAADLLDRRSSPPSSAVLAAEFARLANAGDEDEVEYEEDDVEVGPMGFSASAGTRKRAGGKLALGVAMLTAIAVIGAVLGAKLLNGSPDPQQTTPSGPPTSANAGPAQQPIAISADQIRIVDPPPGDRTELDGAAAAIDGDEKTAWESQGYSRANFGGLKEGMGLLIDLGQPTAVGGVKVTVGAQGASIALRTGTSDPGDTAEGDATIVSTYEPIGQELQDHSGTVMFFPVAEADQRIQYLLVWITKLPADAEGRFRISVNEITVLTP